MMPESDEELVGPRTITECVEAIDGVWDCVLSCGHTVTMVIMPAGMELPGCAQCIHVLIERNRTIL